MTPLIEKKCNVRCSTLFTDLPPKRVAKVHTFDIVSFYQEGDLWITYAIGCG